MGRCPLSHTILQARGRHIIDTARQRSIHFFFLHHPSHPHVHPHVRATHPHHPPIPSLIALTMARFSASLCLRLFGAGVVLATAFSLQVRQHNTFSFLPFL